MTNVGSAIRIFKVDDSSNPGLAKVKILKRTRVILGKAVFSVEVLEVIRPSTSRKLKVGQKLEVSEKLLSPIA